MTSTHTEQNSAIDATTTSRRLPILDMAGLDRGEQAAADFRAELRQTTHDYGFFYLVGHGVDQSLIDELMSTAQAFFALPEADKMAIENLKSPHFRGYTRIGGELTQGQVDWREQIDIGPERPAVTMGPGVPDYLRLEGPNQWPAALPTLKDVIRRWDKALTAVAMRLLQAWARSLGADEHVFDPTFSAEPSVLIKIVRYPGRADSEARQGVGAHKDGGVLTLLLVEPDKGGLQVEKDGEWIDAPPVPGAFVVNIGELLEVATNGYLKATVHRVVSPPAGSSRISIPFFFNPALNSTIPVIPLADEFRGGATGVTADPSNPIFATYGENALKSRLRAHPDVAAIHHPDLVG